MPMPIPAVGMVNNVAPTGYLPATNPADAVNGAEKAGAGSFATVLGGAVDNVTALKSTSNELAIKAVTGDLSDIHSATLASTRAQVTLELVAAVRNKGVDAFNEIMRMQA